jgi:hypothetical protein
MTPLSFGCYNQEELVDQVVRGLLHPRFPSCWNVVVPPSFGEDLLGSALERALRADPREPLVAALSPDEIGSRAMFLDRLRRQWLGDRSAPGTGPLVDVAINRLLADVFAAARQGREGHPRPVVLLLRRFHCILDPLKDDEWVLGRLRTEEQAHRLHTVTLTPMPYTVLKRRWENRKHVFSNSPYGDTHIQLLAEPWPPEEVRRLAEEEGIHGRVADFIGRLTGGYPEALREAIGAWVRDGHRDLTRPVQASLTRLVVQQLERFVKWLDPLEDRRYRDHLINFYHDPGDPEAYDVLASHPWKNALFLGEELRAEALGEAALKAAIGDARERRPLPTAWVDAVERAQQMYQRRRYDTAVKLLESAEGRALRPPVRLLALNARIMRELYGGDEELAAEDIDWQRLRRVLRQASSFLDQHGGDFDPGDRARLGDRYAELDNLAEKVAAATAVKGRYEGRLVDILAGMADAEHRSPRHAALLVWQKYEATRALPGPANACQQALYLPEQIFSVWAFWRFGLNFHEAPPGPEEAWQRVEQTWRQEGRGAGEPLRQPRPGERFSSLSVFAAFVQAFRNSAGAGGKVPPGEHPPDILSKDLSFYEPIRNGKAHALTLTPEGHRKKYFDLIGRWLNYLLAACPDQPLSEGMLQMILAPLPLLSV